jgi:histidinol-phosphatase (PHP family)
MSDAHLHLYPHRSPTNPDAGAPPDAPYPLDLVERFVAAAAARSVAELTFTEHLFRCVESAKALGPFWEHADDPVLAEYTRAAISADRTMSLDGYVDLILRAKQAGLPVLLGLEVDFVPGTIEAVLELVDPYPFDLLIGSVHWIDGWWFDRAAVAGEWDRRGHRRVYEEYFALKTALAATGAVDVLAHPDRIKYLGHRLPEEPLDLYEELVRAAATTGMAFEVNSAGLRHPVAEVYPGPSLLRMVGDAGLEITFGSDGHRADQAGLGLHQARVAAASAGFTRRARFVARRRSLVPFDTSGTPD